MTAPSSRRRFLAGLVALPAAGAPPAFAAVAAIAEAPPHPDQVLLDAERALHRAQRVEREAETAREHARDAHVSELGPWPEALRFTHEERMLCSHPYGRRPFLYLDRRSDFSGSDLPPFAWKAESLRRAIQVAPTALGRGGRAPHLIRRWRGLLPIAEAFDAADAAIAGRLDLVSLSLRAGEARECRHKARCRVLMLPATTTDGLAVKVRLLGDGSLDQMDRSVFGLLEAAAAVCGQTLPDSDPTFDPGIWALEVSRAGGTLVYRPDEADYHVVWPHRERGESEPDVVRDVRIRGDRNRHKITAWLWSGERP